MNGKKIKTNRCWVDRLMGILLLLAFCLASATTVSAQKKKKNQDDSQPTPPPAVAALAPDEQKIDYVIGEFLGAWQVGDIDKLHKNLADDVSVVAGTWTPPALGWPSYLAAYQAQRARMQQVRMERSNTLIRIAPSGNVAWACYQWEFSGMVDGAASAADGQTTLIFEKRGDDWLIIHNHTSLVQASAPTTIAKPAPQAAGATQP